MADSAARARARAPQQSRGGAAARSTGNQPSIADVLLPRTKTRSTAQPASTVGDAIPLAPEGLGGPGRASGSSAVHPTDRSAAAVPIGSAEGDPQPHQVEQVPTAADSVELAPDFLERNQVEGSTAALAPPMPRGGAATPIGESGGESRDGQDARVRNAAVPGEQDQGHLEGNQAGVARMERNETDEAAAIAAHVRAVTGTPTGLEGGSLPLEAPRTEDLVDDQVLLARPKALGKRSGATTLAYSRAIDYVNSMIQVNVMGRKTIVHLLASALWRKMDLIEDPATGTKAKEDLILAAARPLGWSTSILKARQTPLPSQSTTTLDAPAQETREEQAQHPPPPQPAGSGGARLGPKQASTRPQVAVEEDHGGPFTAVKEKRSSFRNKPPPSGAHRQSTQAQSKTFHAGGPRIYLQVELPGPDLPGADQLTRWAHGWASQHQIANPTVRIETSDQGPRIVVTGSPQSEAWTQAYSARMNKGEEQFDAVVRALSSGRNDPLTSLALTTSAGHERVTRASLVEFLRPELEGIPYRLDAMGVYTRGVPGSADEASSNWLLSMAAQETTVMKAIPILRRVMASHPNKLHVQAPYRSNRFILDDSSIRPLQGAPGVSVIGLPQRMPDEVATQRINNALGAMGLPTPAISTIYRIGNELLVRAGYPSKEEALQVATVLKEGKVLCMGIPLAIAPSQSARAAFLQADGRCHFCGQKQAEGKHGYGYCYGGEVRQNKKCQGCGSTSHTGYRHQCVYYTALLSATMEELSTPCLSTPPPLPTPACHPVQQLPRSGRNGLAAPSHTTYREALAGREAQHPVPPQPTHPMVYPQHIQPPAPPPQRAEVTPAYVPAGDATYRSAAPPMTSRQEPDQGAMFLMDLLEIASLQLSAAIHMQGTALSSHDQQRLGEVITRLRTDSLRVQRMASNPRTPCVGQQVVHHG